MLLSDSRQSLASVLSDSSAFTHRADLYARRVLGDGEPIVAGPLVKLACEKHLRERVASAAGEFPYVFDESRANHVIDFFEQVLRLPDVTDEDEPTNSMPFLLQPWQAFIVGSLFGWVKRDGYRRFREAYIEIGKGNGKTPMCAGIGLYGLMMDGERSAQIFAAAADQDQAQTLFQYAVNVVKVSDLDSDLHLSGGKEVWKITHEPSMSYFRTFSRESGAKSGPIPHMGLLDELHEHGSPQISIKIRAGAKRRKQPLFLEITNSGFDRTSICWQHHEHSTRVLQGVVQDDQWFSFVASLDEGDDPLRDESCWLKANPNLGVSVTEDYLRKQVSNANNIPAETNTVLRLNFCVWTQAVTRYFNLKKWMECPEMPSDEELDGEPCYGAVDMGQTDDLSAFARLWVLDGGRFAVKMRYWLPQAALEKYPNRPYEQWQRSGLLTITDGETTDDDLVEDTVYDDCRDSGVLELGVDKRFAHTLMQHWIGRGLTVIDTPQGFALNEAIRKLSQWVVDGSISHGNDPILAWMAANAVTREGRNKELRLDKERSSEKIDGIAALVMAIDRVVRKPVEKPPDYQMIVLGGAR